MQPKPRQQELKRHEFCVGDSVLVRGLWLGVHNKWQNGTITAVPGMQCVVYAKSSKVLAATTCCLPLILGGPRYQVYINGQHSRQVHIDHLQPGIHKDTVTVTDQLMEIPDTDGHDSSPVPSDTVVDSKSMITTAEQLRRSTRLITPIIDNTPLPGFAMVTSRQAVLVRGWD